MIINTYEAAATLTVGTDALRNEQRNVSGQPRIMKAIGIVGGNAINEASLDVYIGDFYVGNFRNTASGVAGIDLTKDLKPVGPHAVPAGDKISAIVRIAPTVSPLLISIL